jgi:hypothetical protein
MLWAFGQAEANEARFHAERWASRRAWMIGVLSGALPNTLGTIFGVAVLALVGAASGFIDDIPTATIVVLSVLVVFAVVVTVLLVPRPFPTPDNDAALEHFRLIYREWRDAGMFDGTATSEPPSRADPLS